MRQRTLWISSAGAGAATAFLFDPVTGRRRRHRLADATVHLRHRASDAASSVRRDWRNRTRGLAAMVRRRWVAEQPDDAVLEERVHSALGRVVSRPHAITVKVDRGHVILDGPVPSGDEHRLVHAVRAVRGVKTVESRFDPHIQPAYELSSGTPRVESRTPRPDILQPNWAPATRALAAGAGAALVGAAVVQRNRSAVGLAVAGAALITRAATNLPVHRLVGIGAGRRAIDVQKAITVDLPADRVFAFWENPANLPTVMHHVREVRTTNEPGQWQWTIAGATGLSIEFVTVLTDRVPDRLLAWKTVEGSTIEHAGIVRFDPLDERRTRIGLRLSYNPPGGALGHAAATLLGADPKSQLDEDLVRMKTALETGHHAYDVAQRSNQ
jgi:uncharacterized membrane protein